MASVLGVRERREWVALARAEELRAELERLQAAVAEVEEAARRAVIAREDAVEALAEAADEAAVSEAPTAVRSWTRTEQARHSGTVALADHDSRARGNKWHHRHPAKGTRSHRHTRRAGRRPAQLTEPQTPALNLPQTSSHGATPPVAAGRNGPHPLCRHGGWRPAVHGDRLAQRRCQESVRRVRAAGAMADEVAGVLGCPIGPIAGLPSHPSV